MKAMFTQGELIAALPTLRGTTPRLLDIAEFNHCDFHCPASEQQIIAVRGSKDYFSGGMHFWIQALEAHDWRGRESEFVPYVQSGLCQPIGELEFVSLIGGYSRSLSKELPSFLFQNGRFRAGLQMYGEWNDVAAVADVSDAYLAFFWSTTA